MAFAKPKKTQLKICGITRPQDLAVCHDLGVDFIGFNFYKKSKRFIEPLHASAMWQSFIGRYPTSKIIPVLVCVDTDIVELKVWIDQFPSYTILQMHGQEDLEHISKCRELFKREIWKAVAVLPDSVQSLVDKYRSVAKRVLLDSAVVSAGGHIPGGSGTSFHWREYANLISQNFVGVAGGINSENIDQLLFFHPKLVDVASGAESAPGLKDSLKILKLVTACRKAFS